MPNPLDYLIKDPNAMRYELMLSELNMRKGGQVKASAGGPIVAEQKRTLPGGPMRNVDWAGYRQALGLKEGSEVKGYAEGGLTREEVEAGLLQSAKDAGLRLGKISGVTDAERQAAIDRANNPQGAPYVMSEEDAINAGLRPAPVAVARPVAAQPAPQVKSNPSPIPFDLDYIPSTLETSTPTKFTSQLKPKEMRPGYSFSAARDLDYRLSTLNPMSPERPQVPAAQELSQHISRHTARIQDLKNQFQLAVAMGQPDLANQIAIELQNLREPKGFAEGGSVNSEDADYLRYKAAQASGAIPGGERVAAEPTPAPARSWVDTLGGVGETGLGFLTGMAAQPAAGIAGAVGETLGLGKGEDIAGRVAQGMTYAPTTAAGQQMQQDLMDFMVKTGVASLPPVVSGINPAALRVMPGTGRYVGQQAVEAARPLHEAYMAGEVPGMPAPASYVVKNKGGNWLPGSVEKNLESLKLNTDIHDEARAMGMPINEQVLAEQKSVNSWIDTKLAKYIKNEMGTPEDPIRALAEKDILHYTPDTPMSGERARSEMNRADFGSTVAGLGESDLAKLWETQSDMSIRGNPVKDWKTQANAEVLASMPWIDKLTPDTPIYQRTNPNMSESLGFTHLVDELRNATGGDATLPQQLRIDPAKLERMSVPEVVNRIADINKWRFEQAGKVAVENIAKLPEAMPSSDPKFTWRNLNNPEDAALSKGAHEAVGKDMGICIGGSDYVGRAAKGQADHFSLFDDKGHPHIAIESRSETLDSAIKKLPQSERDALIGEVEDKMGLGKSPNLADEKLFDQFIKTMDETYVAKYGQPAPSIVQVKGKANETKVNPKYQGQLKDFLNSRQWGRVEETGGLVDLRNQTNLAQKVLKLSPNVPDSNLAAENLRAKLPRFITEDELKAALGVEGYARGGKVKKPTIAFPQDMNYNVDDMRYELARRKG